MNLAKGVIAYAVASDILGSLILYTLPSIFGTTDIGQYRDNRLAIINDLTKSREITF